MICNNCNDYSSSGCGCTTHTHVNNGCGCSEPTECACKAYISSDCVNQVKSVFNCLNIESNLDLTQTLEAMDEAICDALQSQQNNFQIVNIGNGAKVYKGNNLLGQKQLRTFTSDNGTITITESNNDTINLRAITDVNITAGANVTVTEPTPNNFLIAATDTVVQLENSTTTTVFGDGVETPYSVGVVNLQKTILNFPYTLTSADDKYTLFLDNGVNPTSTINIPNGLVNNFSCVFIQKGTGNIVFNNLDSVNLLHPIALQKAIKGQYYWVMIERDTNTSNYYLMGSLKTI